MASLTGDKYGYRILLVEDDRHAIDELRDLLTEDGYECEVALELGTARGILSGRLMDLMAVNAALSDVGDEELVAELKGYNADMALVIYNGATPKRDQRKLRRMGADSYLSSASDLKAVARAIHKVLGNTD